MAHFYVRKHFWKLFHLRSETLTWGSRKESARLLWKGRERKKVIERINLHKMFVMWNLRYWKRLFKVSPSFLNSDNVKRLEEIFTTLYEISIKGVRLIDVRKSVLNLFGFYWWTSNNFSVEAFNTFKWNVFKTLHTPCLDSVIWKLFSQLKPDTFWSSNKFRRVLSEFNCNQCRRMFNSNHIHVEPNFFLYAAVSNKSFRTASAKRRR